MSPKRTTASPAKKHSRSSQSDEKWRIAKEKTKSNQQRGGPSLTRSHRTDLTLSCAAGAHVRKAKRRRLPREVARNDCRTATRDAAARGRM